MAETRIGISSRIRSTSSSMIHPAEMQLQSTPTDPAMPHSSVLHPETKEFKKWRPWLVPCFFIANIAVFLVTMYVNDCPKNSGSCVAGFLGRFSFQPLKENPLLGPSSATLQKMGGLDAKRIVERHQGWRLVTCNWLHGGLLHLLANMLGLLVIGIRLEREFGFVRIGLLYVISGFGGSLLSGLFLQSNISVGASGALFGLLGSMLSELITNWSIYANKVAAFLTLIIIIVVNLAVGILPHVDNFAHIGGFVSGFLLGFVFLIRPQFGWVSQQYGSAGFNHSTRPRYKTYQCALWVVSLVLLIAGFTIGLILLLRGFDANDHCSWCHYLSCVPTSRWSCNNGPSYCMTDQLGNQVNITCSNSGKSGTYILADAASSRIQSLCSQLCT